ncbi:hypothetical protein [Paenarthrobacter sp. YJN-5]|uniref:hypothetical protein n=1 Tax=Paenarthrobacter sp. YJN-5 TaxID=2735316 RepID=UPI001877B1D7|nr:hypothetical protein [Paenarthrobacter sp. YJN-5]QOT15325.1 hypothetical protein HMI59_01125 [Paenarthrobacter sp. YJN-5]
MTDNLRTMPEKHPERLRKDLINLSAVIQLHQAQRLKGAFIPDMPTRALPEIESMLIRAILPLTAQTHRFALNDRQLKQRSARILAHNAPTQTPLDHVLARTRPRQQFGRGSHAQTQRTPER